MSLRVLFSFLVFSLSVFPSAASANAAEEATVAGESLVVYEDMSPQSALVKTLSQGQSVFVTFSIVGSDREWCSIRESAEGGVVGWVRCSELERQVVETRTTVTSKSSQASRPSGKTIGTSIAANTIVTAVGTGSRAGNTTLRALEAQIWQDMQRGKVNPADIERLKREQQKAFLEAGGNPGDVEALERAAMRDLSTGGNESARVLEMTVAKMMAKSQLKPVGDGGPALLAQLRNPAGMTLPIPGFSVYHGAISIILRMRISMACLPTKTNGCLRILNRS